MGGAITRALTSPYPTGPPAGPQSCRLLPVTDRHVAAAAPSPRQLLQAVAQRRDNLRGGAVPAATTLLAPGVGRSGRETAEGEESRGSNMENARRHRHKTGLYQAGHGGSSRRTAGRVALHPGPLPHHVHLQALDHPAVRGLQHGGGEQQVLPE